MPVAVAAAAVGAGASIYGANQASGAAGASRDLQAKINNFNNLRDVPFVNTGVDALGRAADSANRFGGDVTPFAANVINSAPTAGNLPSVPGQLTGPSAPGQIAAPDAPAQMTQAQLEATPGYQFNLSQGLAATQNSAAARGLGVSGAALKGAATFATGLADSTYQQQFNNQLANFGVQQQRFADQTGQQQQQFTNQQTVFGNQAQQQQQQFGNQQTQFGDRQNLFSNANNIFTNELALNKQGFDQNVALGTIGANVATGAGTQNVISGAQQGNAVLAGGQAQAAGTTGVANAVTGGVNNYLQQQYLAGLQNPNGSNVSGTVQPGFGTSIGNYFSGATGAANNAYLNPYGGTGFGQTIVGSNGLAGGGV